MLKVQQSKCNQVCIRMFGKDMKRLKLAVDVPELCVERNPNLSI